MKNSMRILTAVLMFTGGNIGAAYGQGCCTPGTSALSGAERGVSSPRTLKVALSLPVQRIGPGLQWKYARRRRAAPDSHGSSGEYGSGVWIG